MRQLRRASRLVRRAVGLVTALGWTVLVLAAAAWIVAAWLGWREWLVLATVALVVFVLAIGFTVGRLDLDARIGVNPSRVVVGDRAAGELTLSNRRSRTARGLRVELPVGRAVAVFAVPHLKGAGRTDELFVVPTQRRAIIPVGPLTTVQGDPLGLLRRTRRWTDIEEIYVHPRTAALSTMTAGLIRDMEGQTTSALSSSDIAFHTLREYVRGDDLRHVHWKSSAKLGELMVRQYNDTRRSHVAVLLSIDPSEYATEDEFELGISCAASVAVQAIRDEQTLTVIVGDEEFPAINPTRLLDRFSGIEGRPGVGDIAATIRRLRAVAPQASVAVMCTGSRLGIPEMRMAATRAGLDMSTIVLRSVEGGESNYRVVGTSRFVNVPNLNSLDRGMSAVLT
jgi:uncharacterized protein (DUF58 family)